MIKTSSLAADEAAALLENGGVVICPTDTVYGFLADASNKKAVDKIYKIKKRLKSKPLPVFVADVKMAKDFAHVDARQEKMVKKYWPGKYTFILKRKPEKTLYGVDKKTIAIRIPDYPFLKKILKRVSRPLVQTSVNVSGQLPLASIEQVVEVFGDNHLVNFIIDGGNLKNAKPSRIVDLTKEKVVRLR